MYWQAIANTPLSVTLVVTLRDDFWEGNEDSNFQFSESSGSLNGPDLFTELPYLLKSLPNPSFT